MGPPYTVAGSALVVEDSDVLLVQRRRRRSGIRGTPLLASLNTMRHRSKGRGGKPGGSPPAEAGIDVTPQEIVGIYLDWSDEMEQRLFNVVFRSPSPDREPAVPRTNRSRRSGGSRLTA